MEVKMEVKMEVTIATFPSLFFIRHTRAESFVMDSVVWPGGNWIGRFQHQYS